MVSGGTGRLLNIWPIFVMSGCLQKRVALYRARSLTNCLTRFFRSRAQASTAKEALVADGKHSSAFFFALIVTVQIHFSFRRASQLRALGHNALCQRSAHTRERDEA